MNNNQQNNIKAKLEELEAELKQQTTTAKEKVKTVYAEVAPDNPQEEELATKIYSWLSLARKKFNDLSAGGKLVVGVAALWFSITTLNFALHLISSLITVAILGVVLYFAYQKLIVEN